jgi:hypothetical protein
MNYKHVLIFSVFFCNHLNASQDPKDGCLTAYVPIFYVHNYQLRAYKNGTHDLKSCAAYLTCLRQLKDKSQEIVKKSEDADKIEYTIAAPPHLKKGYKAEPFPEYRTKYPEYIKCEKNKKTNQMGCAIFGNDDGYEEPGYEACGNLELDKCYGNDNNDLYENLETLHKMQHDDAKKVEFEKIIKSLQDLLNIKD